MNQRRDPVPLRDAVYFYAPRRLREELERARELPGRKILEKVPKEPGEAIKAAVTAFSGLIEDLNARREPYFEMERHLIRKLKTSRLEAWGVQIKPKESSRLVHIPYYFIDEKKVDFRTNSITFGEKLFRSVEIRKPQPLKAPIKKIKKAGRKSINHELDVKIEILKLENRLRDIQKKEMVSRVRDEARMRYPNIFRVASHPSATKIREALKRAGL